MGNDFAERLRWKEEFHSLKVELERDYGLSPIASKALVRRIGELLDSYLPGLEGGRLPGQISYPAVAIEEPAGKPIRFCATSPVRLTILHESDIDVLRDEGTPALRRVRLLRMSTEAYNQGTALSYEDLSLILGVDRSTIRCLANACTRSGRRPMTRGVVQDIGPAISHKQQVVKLYYQGLLPAHIAARTGHRLGSVERYLTDYARVVHLKLNGLTPKVISRITTLSRKTIHDYLALYRKHDRTDCQAVTERLLSRFAPLEETGAGEHDHA